MAFRTLSHVIDLDCLRLAYQRTRKTGAVGVDGQTATQYAEHLEENLTSLLSRFRLGTYRAPPVRRVHIPKGDGKTRPIGVPTFEDKILQRAVTQVLNAVYEQDFYGFSKGFRPGRSAHDALADLRENVRQMDGGTIVEVDIRAFFDTLDHRCLRRFLDRRVVDRKIRRQIDKWLKAGVLEDGRITHDESGTPQGGVISPLLANVYLHEVLDKWFVKAVQPSLRGEAHLVRYADDFIIAFSNADDAQRVLKVLPQRFAKFGLEIHPDKTRVVPFHRPRGSRRSWCGARRVTPPRTFDFLGFTHMWHRSRRGFWVILRKTSRHRFTRALAALQTWCRANRHQPIPVQQRALNAKLRGHCGYYGITGNAAALCRFRHELQMIWYAHLNRRSQRRSLTWKAFNARLKQHPLVPAHVRKTRSETTSKA